MAFVKRFIFLFFPVFLVAQPDSGTVNIKMDVLNVDDLDQRIISSENKITSASRLPQDIRDIPFTGYVITADEIRQRGYSTLVDVLRDLPGIKVSQPGSALHGETFLMRGLFGNYYVKILVDDLPIQPSGTSGMPIGAQLPVAQAERIEVIYGPAAAIYGADAMAGVINIVTKKADKLNLIDADLNVGFPGNYRFDLTVGGKFVVKNSVWNYLAYGGFQHFNNLPITGSKYQDSYNPSIYVLPGQDSLYLNNPDYKGTKDQPSFSSLPDESQKFGLRLGTKKFTVGFDYGKRSIHSAIGSNPLYRTYHDPNTTFGEEIIRTFASYKTNVGKWFSQSNLQLLIYQISNNSSYITVDNPYSISGLYYMYSESADLYGEQFFSRSLGDRWNILLGVTGQFSGNLPQVDLFSQPFNSSNYRLFSTEIPAGFEFLSRLGIAPYNFLNLGGIMEVDYKTERLSLLVGLRTDYREFYGLAFNPRIGVVLKTGQKSRLRATVSTAYRPPSSYLIYSGVASIRLNDSISVSLPLPNNELIAERLLNADVGWFFEFRPKHSFDISGFAHYNANLISRTSQSISDVPGLDGYYGYVNDDSSSATLFGLQLVHRIALHVGRGQVQSTASVQFAKGAEKLLFGRGELDDYRMQPVTSLKWLIEVKPFTRWYTSLRFHYFSSWTTRSVIIPALKNDLTADGFYTVDLQLRYSLDARKDIYLMINNLTNNAYYGIGASGGAGVLGTRVIFEDIVFNPQLLRVIKVGVRITL